ncbi:MAG: hypothetical protein JOZ84_10285 [Methylobacteriaceae bacterium]|nr:hypothetical protein [Methylobacteriaceae bacterium]
MYIVLSSGSSATTGERRMPVKFSYDPQFGLRIEPELDSELSREEAMIVAVRDLGAGMNSLSQAMWEFYEEFRFKQFYKTDAPSPARVDETSPPRIDEVFPARADEPAPAPAARTRKPAKKPSAPARKKAPAVKSKKRRK